MRKAILAQISSAPTNGIKRIKNQSAGTKIVEKVTRDDKGLFSFQRKPKYKRGPAS